MVVRLVVELTRVVVEASKGKAELLVEISVEDAVVETAVEVEPSVVDVVVWGDGVTVAATSVLYESVSVSGTGLTGEQLLSVAVPTLTDMTLSELTQKPAPGSTSAPPETDHTMVVGIAATEE